MTDKLQSRETMLNDLGALSAAGAVSIHDPGREKGDSRAHPVGYVTEEYVRQQAKGCAGGNIVESPAYDNLIPVYLSSPVSTVPVGSGDRAQSALVGSDQTWHGVKPNSHKDYFHFMEGQACSETRTIQFGVHDHSGDYHSEEPGAVAFNYETAVEIAHWILANVPAALKQAPSGAVIQQSPVGSYDDGVEAAARYLDGYEPSKEYAAEIRTLHASGCLGQGSGDRTLPRPSEREILELIEQHVGVHHHTGHMPGHYLTGTKAAASAIFARLQNGGQ